MEFSFETIEAPVTDILSKEKGSKFIGFVYPVQNEDEVKKVLTMVRELHPKATHHCYAYRLGISGENYRANDDGEPSGSAGLPIYNQILAHQLTQTLAIVVRYYGGTKLGVSGLVKAYKESAKATIESANIITKELETKLELQFDYHQQNIIFTLLNKMGAKITDFITADICTIKSIVKMAEKENISNQLSEMQNISFQFSES